LLHQVGDLFKLNVKLRCQNVNTHTNKQIPALVRATD